jgi:protein tyrosine/serine phosphatase
MVKIEPIFKKRNFVQYIMLLLFIVATLLAPIVSIAADRPANWATIVTLPGAENFYMVTPELYRSAQPSSKAMEEYEHFGIKTVLDLRRMHNDKDIVQNTNLILLNVPMHAWHIEDEDVVQALSYIRTAKKPILVHCRYGADRTGVIIAMYRIMEEGWSKEDAIKEMTDGGYNFHTVWGNIITYIDNVDVNSIRAKLNKNSSILNKKKSYTFSEKMKNSLDIFSVNIGFLYSV